MKKGCGTCRSSKEQLNWCLDGVDLMCTRLAKKVYPSHKACKYYQPTEEEEKYQASLKGNSHFDISTKKNAFV